MFAKEYVHYGRLLLKVDVEEWLAFGLNTGLLQSCSRRNLWYEIQGRFELMYAPSNVIPWKMNSLIWMIFKRIYPPTWKSSNLSSRNSIEESDNAFLLSNEFSSRTIKNRMQRWSCAGQFLIWDGFSIECLPILTVLSLTIWSWRRCLLSCAAVRMWPSFQIHFVLVPYSIASMLVNMLGVSCGFITYKRISYSLHENLE